MITKILIDGTKLNSEDRRAKMSQVALEIHQVLNSTVFRDKVMKMRTQGERSEYKKASNVEIYQMLMRGAEVLNPVVDYTWNIYIDDYYSFKNVIGYTKLNTKYIYVNTKFFDGRITKLIGSNIVHEQSHKLGFSHDFRNTKDREFSVSYQLNKAYEAAYDILFGYQPTNLKTCTRSWRNLWRQKCSWKWV